MSPALVIDYAWTHPDPAAIRAAGYSGVMRYLSPDASKNLSPAELLALHAVGLAVGLVWEAGATSELGGQAAGVQESDAANALATQLQWPADRPIYYAADFPASGGQLAVVHEYLVGATAPGKRPVGIYGGIGTVDTMLAEGACHWGWQTSAWSSGRVSALAQLYQRQQPTRPLQPPGSFDEDVALRPDWGGWDGKPAAVPAGPTQVTTGCVGMAAAPGSQGYWLAEPDGTVHVHGKVGWHGDLRGKALAAPIVGIAATSSGLGYWLVGADGGVFTFGDAHFYGAG